MTVLGVLILVCALFLVVSVLLQSSKNHRMSGVVSGGAETFFGKQKGKTIDAKLSKATAVISVIFAVLVLVMYAVNGGSSNNNVIVDPNAGIVVEGTEAEDGAAADDANAEDGAAADDANAEDGAAADDANAEDGAAAEDANAEDGAAE